MLYALFNGDSRVTVPQCKSNWKYRNLQFCVCTQCNVHVYKVGLLYRVVIIFMNLLD